MSSSPPQSQTDLVEENARLQARLDGAEETLRAIRCGKVDALFVEGPEGPMVFTLKGAERGYRVLVETMTEGAVTLRANGVIYYCNARFAEMVRMPLEKVIGLRFAEFIALGEVSVFQRLLENRTADRRGEFCLRPREGNTVPVLVAMNALPDEDEPGAFVW